MSNPVRLTLTKTLYRSARSGIFTPLHPSKFRGKLPIKFKSALEAKFMMYLDRNPLVVKWSYEPFSIPYLDKVSGKVRQYFIDFVVEFNLLTENKNGLEIKNKVVWVETKSKSETKTPRRNKRKSNEVFIEQAKTYATNQCKWISAEKIAKSKGCDFVVLTEDFFQNAKL